MEKNARIVCWDVKNKDRILALVPDISDDESPLLYQSTGLYYAGEQNNRDLFLSVPEWTTFKDGDILISDFGNPFIYNGEISKYGNYGSYCGINSEGDLIFGIKDWTSRVKGYANEKQENILLGHLKRDWNTKSKEYLKRFFGVEEKNGCDLKPKDWVLTRENSDDVWKLDIFSHSQWDDSEVCYHYYCVGGWNYECVPYEGNEKLLGTKMGLEDLK